uniref:Uncharacterized protein n=1 Tax=viral metagenome TaxID=1070528 RepID=A0A6C0JRC3_9ZZZZ
MGVFKKEQETSGHIFKKEDFLLEFENILSLLNSFKSIYEK